MKLPSLVLPMLCLAACHTPSHPPSTAPSNPTAAAVPAEMDFTAYAGREMSVGDFLHACQQASGFNFTYNEATGEALKASSLRLPEVKRVKAAEFRDYLDARLSPAGFVCQPVGPENLRVYLVLRRTT